MDGLAEQKKKLRAALNLRRKEAALDGAHAGLALRGHFFSHFQLPPDRCIAFYLAQGDEMDVAPLAGSLAALGHALCLPVVEQPNVPLVFRAYQTGDALRLGPMKIPEPLLSAPLVLPDVLLVPLVGFDRRGNRLGQGGGFYDRTLLKLKADREVLAIGVAYAAQEAPVIPSGPHDVPLDAIVTERGLILPEPI